MRILTTLLSFCLLSGSLHAQGTAFSYQGRLDQNGIPATGNFNFQFQLYTNATIGNQFGGPIARNGVAVSNGLFTVSLDFGSTVFFGWPLWLQMWVAPSNQPPSVLTMLSPRQPVTPAPYAIFANTASNTAVNAVGTTSLQNNAVTSTKLASGAAVRSLNGLTDAISLIAGPNIAITPVGGTLQISASLRPGSSSTPGSIVVATDPNANIGFSDDLRVLSPGNVLYSGNISGGRYNSVAAGLNAATISGGGALANENQATASFATIAGGGGNVASGTFSTVLGGLRNQAGGDYSVAAGRQAKANHHGSFVWGDSQLADFSSTTANEFSIRALGGLRLSTDTSLYFGNQTRQMLNLWSTGYGIGVQNNTLYERSADDFAWYRGGAHTNDYGNAGGGTEQMRLHANGRLSVSGDHVQVKGAGNEQAFLGGDGNGDVEIGSDNNNVSTVVLWNRGRSDHMDLYARDASVRVLTIRGGADLAEPFQMSEGNLAKGSLVIIDDQNPGKLKLSAREYDTRVAGILSGANGVNAGITLQQEGLLEGGQNVALSGRVYALADATEAPIKPGDLLTSSGTPGHVMSVREHGKAQGAIVGKAMGALAEGKGMVLVLVSLQ